MSAESQTNIEPNMLTEPDQVPEPNPMSESKPDEVVEPEKSSAKPELSNDLEEMMKSNGKHLSLLFMVLSIWFHFPYRQHFFRLFRTISKDWQFKEDEKYGS